MKMTVNAFGQKTFSGKIRLKADTEMLNRANDGLEWGDRRWREPTRIIVPAGTEVEYLGQETRSGKYHTVTYRSSQGVFCATQKTDDINYGS